jgi:hypothetical protein
VVWPFRFCLVVQALAEHKGCCFHLLLTLKFSACGGVDGVFTFRSSTSAQLASNRQLGAGSYSDLAEWTLVHLMIIWVYWTQWKWRDR